MWKFLSIIFTVLLSLFYSPKSAHSFERNKSDLGVPLRWMLNPIPFVIDSAGLGDFFQKNPKLGAPGSEFKAVEYGFGTWANVTCQNGKKISLKWAYQGRVSGKSVGFDPNCSNCNTNLVIFIRNNWRYDRLRVAVTTTSYNNETGEILDADMELNAVNYQFSTTTTPGYVKWDVQSVVTHEVGHFLGLGHSKDPNATMRAKYGPGQLQLRTLQPDDIRGICSIYSAPVDTGFPKYTLESRDYAMGCSVNSDRPSPLALLLLLPVFLIPRLRGRELNN